MMMRLVQVSSTESISSISASSAQNGGNLYLRRGSVCGSCRVLKPNRVAYNSMILSAMRTCGFHTVLPKLSASVSSRKRFSSTASPLISQTTSPFAHPRSSVIVSSLLSPSDIPQKEWFALRKEKLTTSTFSTVLGFWKGTRRAELWHEKVYPKLSASVSSRKRFSSTASPLISQTTSPFAYPRSSVIVSSLLSPSDIPQKSKEWFALRKDKLTTSTFSTALGFWKGTRRAELWHEKVYDSDSRVVEESARFAMNWGVQMESAAIERYKRIMGCEVGTMGFAIHSNEQLHWLGASPDGILDCFGILEVKCPYNKGKTETVLPWKKVPYYYMPQLQGQMEIMDREWVNLYCWTRNGSTVFRVMRDRSYWKIIHDVLREFWWENVLPAREALLLGKEDEEVKKYEPTSTHKRTGLAISKSITLAGESKLVCREIADHVEFF